MSRRLSVQLRSLQRRRLPPTVGGLCDLPFAGQNVQARQDALPRPYRDSGIRLSFQVEHQAILRDGPIRVHFHPLTARGSDTTLLRGKAWTARAVSQQSQGPYRESSTRLVYQSLTQISKNGGASVSGTRSRVFPQNLLWDVSRSAHHSFRMLPSRHGPAHSVQTATSDPDHWLL